MFISCFLVFAGAFQALAQDEVSADDFEKSRLSERPVLLVFSGSDWCMPCMRIEQEILNHDRFISFAHNKLTIVKADFPQRQKLKKDVIKRNEYLAEKFNRTGQFPKILLLQREVTKGEVIDYAHWSVDFFIQDIKDKIKARTHRTFDRQELLMGTQFGFTLVDTANSHRAEVLLDRCVAEVRRLEYLISEWIDTSQVSVLNRNAGRDPVCIDPELYELIKRSKILSGITQGAFDITFAGLGHLWKFDGHSYNPPDSVEVLKALSLIGHRKIELRDSNEVYLPHEGMKIGFGGMGKGYAADRVKEMMIAQGIEDGVINASGDLIAWGKPPGEEFWKIAIADPENTENVLYWLPISNKAVATSGDYEKFLIINGKRYAHIIDPKTGYPTTGIKSTTVRSKRHFNIIEISSLIGFDRGTGRKKCK